MNFRKKSQSGQSVFQMAPMIDIMFLLLVFFMVISAYAQQESRLGIQLPTAKSGSNDAREMGEIIINLDENEKIFINDKELSIEQLHAILEKVASTYVDQPVILRADHRVSTGATVRIIDKFRELDIQHFSISATKKKSD